MKETDYKIKQALQSKVQPINDNSFTKSIIDAHLAKKQAVKCYPFSNFSPFIIGISLLLISLGLLFFIKQEYQWTNTIGVSFEDGLILVIIIITFLLYTLIDEFIFGGFTCKSLTKLQP